MVQKCRSTKCPRKEESCWLEPRRSHSEKFGAGSGSRSQVAKESGDGSLVCGSLARAQAGGEATNGFARRLSEPSSSSIRWLAGNGSKTCVSPLGQRIVARTVLCVFPIPKKSSLLCCDMKPEPAWRYLVWRWPSHSTVTADPIASRLLLLPRRRKAIDEPRSLMALERLSSGKSKPTTPETSENVPSRLLAKTTFRS